ncbi:MAG TPA: aldehyde dehydrogenase family protein [Thermoanaerobaculia bacterium]
MSEPRQPQKGTPPIPDVAAPGVTSHEAMDKAVADVTAKKAEWTAVTAAERVALLDELAASFAGVAERWARAGMAAEGLDPALPASSEEWLTGPYFTLRNLRLLKKSLQGIAAHGRPAIPGPVATLDTAVGRRVSARVFPQDLYDRLFYTGVTAEVWMQPEVTEATLAASQAVAYRAKDEGGVALVLAAGNVSSIGPMDALYKLFAEDRVVVFKTHPVNDYLTPLFAEAFAPLVRRGFLRLVPGGAAEGAYLCAHPGIDEIHITGSDKTYEAIVFGPGEEGRQRKAAGTPHIAKPVSAELGNVSPVIVVPGPWSDADLAYQAENLVTMLTNNAGFNCNATRVIVQHASWPQREGLLDGVRRLFARVPERNAYYPGAADRYASFLKAHPDAERFGEEAAGKLPWTLIGGLDPSRRDDPCFTTEAFCSVFSEVGLAAASVPEYLEKAVEFANGTLWGTLNATLLVHPHSLADPDVARAFEAAIARLRYGTVSINHWAAIGYGLVVTPWGAPPGHPPTDIQSGNGVVHNTLLFSRVEKTVVRAPFRVWPKPAWFVTHRTADRLTERLTRFEAAPSPAKLPGIFSLALRG